MSGGLQKKIRQWNKTQALKTSILGVKGSFIADGVDLPIENLSARAVGVCKRNGLSTLKALLDHCYQFETFQMFLGCGEKTDKELMTFCKGSRPLELGPSCCRCEYTGIQ